MTSLPPLLTQSKVDEGMIIWRILSLLIWHFLGNLYFSDQRVKNKKNNVTRKTLFRLTFSCFVNVTTTLWRVWSRFRVCVSLFTVVQVAGDGGMGEDEVVEVGVLLECWKISSSKCECPGGEVATSVWAAGEQRHGGRRDQKQALTWSPED